MAQSMRTAGPPRHRATHPISRRSSGPPRPRPLYDMEDPDLLPIHLHNLLRWPAMAFNQFEGWAFGMNCFTSVTSGCRLQALLDQIHCDSEF